MGKHGFSEQDMQIIAETLECAEKVGLRPEKKVTFKYIFRPNPYYIKEIRELFDDFEEDDIDTKRFVPVIVVETTTGNKPNEIIVDIKNGIENLGSLYLQMSIGIKVISPLFDIEAYVTWAVFNNIGNFCWEDALGELEYAIYGEGEEDEEY